MQTKEEDRWVSPYNAYMLLLFYDHIKVEYCTSEGLAAYVIKYVIEPEPRLLITLSDADKTAQHLSFPRMSSMDCMVLLLGHRIFRVSNSAKVLPIAVLALRSSTVRLVNQIEQHSGHLF